MVRGGGGGGGWLEGQKIYMHGPLRKYVMYEYELRKDSGAESTSMVSIARRGRCLGLNAR